MQKKTLEDLIHDLGQEMLRLGYTEGTMKIYRRRWFTISLNVYLVKITSPSLL